MTVSVVMAVFNGESYIREQLDSILSQSRLPDEIIVCDDCSDDGTYKILGEYLAIHPKCEKVHIQVFKNEERLGYALNFKKAIDISKGEIVFLSDQDDIWLEKKVETCLKIMNENPDIMALSTGYEYINETGERIKRTHTLSRKVVDFSFPIKRIGLKEFVKYPKYPGMAMVFKKEVWSKMNENNIIDWKLKPAHDWAINFVAALFGGMFFYEGKTVLYRQHGMNTAGVLASQSGNNAYMHRLATVKGIIKNLQSVQILENNKDFLQNELDFQIRRLEKLEKGKLSELVFFELINLKYTALKPLIGDIYALLNRKGKKNA